MSGADAAAALLHSLPGYHQEVLPSPAHVHQRHRVHGHDYDGNQKIQQDVLVAGANLIVDI